MSAEFTPHTADELASMRATLEATLVDTCVLQQPSRTTSGSGTTTNYNTFASGVLCRIGPFPVRMPEERMIAGKFQGQALYYITLAYDQSFQNDFRIAVTGGDTFEIVGRANDRGENSLSTRLVCRKVAQED